MYAMLELKECYVCGAEHSRLSDTCEKCQAIINRLKDRKHRGKRYGARNVRKALKNAEPLIDEESGDVKFKCHYTKIYGKFNPTAKSGLDPMKDASVLTIDHENPDDLGSLVVSLNIVNEMKHNIPRDKFEEIITALGKYFGKEMSQKEFEEQFKKLVQCLD